MNSYFKECIKHEFKLIIEYFTTKSPHIEAESKSTSLFTTNYELYLTLLSKIFSILELSEDITDVLIKQYHPLKPSAIEIILKMIISLINSENTTKYLDNITITQENIELYRDNIFLLFNALINVFSELLREEDLKILQNTEYSFSRIINEIELGIGLFMTKIEENKLIKYKIVDLGRVLEDGVMKINPKYFKSEKLDKRVVYFKLATNYIYQKISKQLLQHTAIIDAFMEISIDNKQSILKQMY